MPSVLSKVAGLALPVALALSGARTAHAAPCVPSAALGGDAGAVAQVGAELARLGDALARDAAQAAAPGCRFVVAAVAREPGGAISVAVRDGARSEDRRLSDASLAAEWIDSWLHDAVLAPPALVPARDVDDPPGAPAALHAATAPAPRTDRVMISASGLDSLDRGSWLGASGGACVRAGAFCFGARLGYAQQDEHVGATGAARTDLFALATASWSHALGHAMIEPELGAGVGWLATDRAEACMPGSTGMPCAPPLAVYVGDHFHAETYSPRLAAALRVELPVASHVWLEGSAGVMVSPLAHTDPYPPNLPGPPPVPPQLLVLPGEPMATVQLAVGLRVGVP